MLLQQKISLTDSAIYLNNIFEILTKKKETQNTASLIL